MTVDGVSYCLQRSQVHGSIWGLYPTGATPKRHTVEEITQATVPILPELRDTPIALVGIFVDDLYPGPASYLQFLHQVLQEHV